MAELMLEPKQRSQREPGRRATLNSVQEPGKTPEMGQRRAYLNRAAIFRRLDHHNNVGRLVDLVSSWDMDDSFIHVNGNEKSPGRDDIPHWIGKRVCTCCQLQDGSAWCLGRLEVETSDPHSWLQQSRSIHRKESALKMAAVRKSPQRN